ncbi:MAG: hypothetical protein V3T70_00890 [Phycisphaerae bacterium]
MLAISSAWLGLIACVLSVTMVFYRPVFHDSVIPVVLYGAVLAIGCGGLVMMRRDRSDDQPDARTAQKLQAQVGIGLGMAAVVVTYALFAMAESVVRAGP